MYLPKIPSNRVPRCGEGNLERLAEADNTVITARKASRDCYTIICAAISERLQTIPFPVVLF